MKSIYQNARMVRIWLGECERFEEIPREFSWRDTLFPTRQRIALTYRTLYDRSWFFRKWTLQEIVLARKAVVHCGIFKIPWTDLEEACNSDYSRYYDDRTDRIEAIRNIRKAFEKKERIRLSNLLLATRFRKSTDDRDMVYAVMGLLSTTRNSLHPDYSLSTEETYINAAWHCIKEEKDLSILHAAGYHEGSSLPSWAADWRKPPLNWAGLDRAAVRHGWWGAGPKPIFEPSWSKDVPGKRHRWWAAGSSKPIFGSSRSKDVIKLRGFVVGTFERYTHLDHPRVAHAHEEGTSLVSGEWLASAFFDSDFSSGSFPTSAEEGDWICILFGGPLPYVLRPCAPSLRRSAPSKAGRSPRCRFIGACWVSELMGGYAMLAKPRRSKNFVLC
jgi:hypothetical protein